MPNQSNYHIWFPPDGEILTLATLYRFQKVANQVGINSPVWDHKNQVYVTGDQLECLALEASRIFLAPLTCFYDYLLAFDRRLTPRREIYIELDKTMTIKSLREYSKRPIDFSEPKLKATPETYIRSWRIRVFCDEPDWLWLGYSYSPEEVRAVADQTPILVKSEAELQAWLSTRDVFQR